jgi:hypothetical protein
MRESRWSRSRPSAPRRTGFAEPNGRTNRFQERLLVADQTPMAEFGSRAGRDRVQAAIQAGL